MFFYLQDTFGSVKGYLHFHQNVLFLLSCVLSYHHYILCCYYYYTIDTVIIVVNVVIAIIIIIIIIIYIIYITVNIELELNIFSTVRNIQSIPIK